jgi:hypothetical protein
MNRAAPLVAIACLACQAPQIMSARKQDGGRTAAREAAAEDELPRDAGAVDSFFVVSAIDAYYDVMGAGSQVYCPGKADAKQPQSCAALGVMVDPYYADKYTCYDLAAVPGGPTEKYGGLTLTMDKCSTTMLIGKDANLPSGNLYAVEVVRDGNGHISGFTGKSQIFAAAPSNDGGVAYGPDNVLFVTRWPTNELQQTKFGSMLADKVIPLDPLGVAFSSASLSFVPSMFPSAGTLKLMSWSGGEWYTLAIKPDGRGTYDVVSATQDAKLDGGPEGFVYVEAGSPLFPKNSLLVSEWTAKKISTYEADDKANPVLGSRRDFITGLTGAEGAYRDPATGDFFFTTWGQRPDRVVVVRGFSPIVIR